MLDAEKLKKKYQKLEDNKELNLVLNWKDPSFKREREETKTRKRKPCDNDCDKCLNFRC